MKKSIKKSLKPCNGITLIALVITIIVLLILAGISISMLSGNNSILQRTTDAKTNKDNAQIGEKIKLAYSSALTKDISSQKSEVQKSTFEDELEVEFPNKTISIENSTDNKEWIVTIDGVSENVPIGKDTPTVLKVAEYQNKKFSTNTELEDLFGNKITVPAGFKITNDSPKSVTEGIVIEDVDAGTQETTGSQFVWIPVGTIYRNSNKTETKTITLARNWFFPGNTIDTSSLKTEPTDQVQDSWGYYYVEETTFREGSNTESKNATALNILEFLSSAKSKRRIFYRKI